MEAPRDNLTRSASFEVTRADDDGDGLTLEGYAAVFDSPIEIDSWEGRFTETIARGAFAKTIKERTPVLQFDHGSHPMLGSMPLGKITEMAEDDHGLRIKARLSDSWMVEPVRHAIADGAVTGMSFRFSVVKDEWDHDTEPATRTVREVKLYEAGPVVFPAYESTSVGVRARKVAAELTDPELRAELERMIAESTPIEPPDEGTRSEPLEAETEEPDDSTPQGDTPDARESALRELSLQEITA